MKILLKASVVACGSQWLSEMKMKFNDKPNSNKEYDKSLRVKCTFTTFSKVQILGKKTTVFFVSNNASAKV